jgi:Pentapeptide repeats (9 copies)
MGPRTRLDGAHFADEARFGGTVFDSDVSFNRAIFEGSASFYYASGKRPSFEGTEFRHRDPFVGAQFLR